MAAWLLFVVGFINFCLGLIFRRRAKDARSFSPMRRARARGQLVMGPIDKLGAFVGDGRSPTPRNFFKPSRWGSRQAAAGDDGHDEDMKRHHGATPIRNMQEAFNTSAGLSPQELMRIRAREANAKAEQEADARLAAAFGTDRKDTSMDHGLSGAFVYDSARGTPVALGKTHSRSESLDRYPPGATFDTASISRRSSVHRPQDDYYYSQEHSARSAAKGHAGTYEHSLSEPYEKMVPSPPYASEPPSFANAFSPEKKPRPLPRSKRPPSLVLVPSPRGVPGAYPAVKRPNATAATAAIKRRSLALAKAARKRLSTVGGATSSSSRSASPARQKAAMRLRKQQRSFASFVSESTRNSRFVTPSGSNTPRLPSLTKQRLLDRAQHEREQLARLAKELKLESLAGSPRSLGPKAAKQGEHHDEPVWEHVAVPSRKPSTSGVSTCSDDRSGAQVLPLRRSSSASASVYSQVTRPTALSLVSPMPSTQYRTRRSSNGEESHYGHSNYRGEYDFSPTYSTTTAGALTSVSRAPRRDVPDVEEPDNQLKLPVASRWQSEWTSAATFAAGKAAKRQPGGI